MGRLPLSDLDELVLAVRDRTSREYVHEAVVAYRAGSLRAAVVSTWTAVSFDLISKIRELASQADSAAEGFMSVFDRARSTGNTQRLQKIESELLSAARGQFELLTATECTDLQRLRDDRHLCAHPAFSTSDSLFQPSPELVRAHLAHSLAHVLTQPPVQGRAALERIKHDLLQPSFPGDQEHATRFMRAKYLDRAKESLIESLLKVCLKTVLAEVEPELVGHKDRVVRSLIAVSHSHPEKYASIVPRELRRLCADLSDVELQRVFLLVSEDPSVWEWLDEPARLRLREAVTNTAFEDDYESLLLGALAIPELRDSLLATIAATDGPTRERLVAQYPSPELAEIAVDVFVSAGGYRHAEHLGTTVLLPMARYLDARQIARVLRGVEENGQIWFASEMPRILVKFFAGVAPHHDENRRDWQNLMSFFLEREPNKEDHYAYPELRKAMERGGLWPAVEASKADATAS